MCGSIWSLAGDTAALYLIQNHAGDSTWDSDEPSPAEVAKMAGAVYGQVLRDGFPCLPDNPNWAERYILEYGDYTYRLLKPAAALLQSKWIKIFEEFFGRGLNGIEPLYYTLVVAAMYGNETIVKALLESGINVNSGWSWELGCFEPNRTRQFRADVIESDGPASQICGMVNPLQMAILKNRESTVQLLLEAGGDLEATDEEDMTLLDRAVKSGATNSIISLIQAGSNVETGSRYTPLGFAIEQGDEQLLRTLIHKGVNINSLTLYYTGSDLKNLCVMTALKCVCEQPKDTVERVLTRRHFMLTMKTIRATGMSKTMLNEFRNFEKNSRHEEIR
ncbi:MAG: hypothetical protein M1834_002124 [Cirrosporium novae-zelandiae]|nr:MAG: hypothetical protein M1834_002124 [Cirrosporium novae-zelandiae]